MFSLNGAFTSERATISIETTCIRLAIAQGKKILRGESLPLPPGTIKNGQVMDTAVFVQTLTELTRRLNAPRRRAVISLSGEGALVRTLQLPAVPPRMLDEAVNREARRELPLPLDEIYLAWHPINGREPGRQHVLAVAVPRLVMDSHMAGIHQAGLRPSSMDLKPLALVRAANHADVVLVDLDGKSGSVILVRDFVPVIVRSVVVPRTAVQDPDDKADFMVSEIQRTLDFYRSTQAGGQAAWSPVVCLTGDLGEENAVQERAAVQWPLLPPAPPQTGSLPLPLVPYLVNVGLALKKGL